jgi:hypothetical protein
VAPVEAEKPQEPISPGADAGEITLAEAKERITELERMAADDSRRWAALNTENVTLRAWQRRVKEAVGS